VSSSYSRPGIRQTNANAGAPSIRQTRIKQRAQAPAFGTGPRFDNYSDPGTAGRNAGQTFDEISRFLSDAIEPAVKIADDISLKNAQKQVGDLLASNPNLGQLYNESPEAVQNKIRSMSSRAQDLTLSNLARSEAFAFSKSFPAAVINDELLKQPTTDANREAQTKRFNDLRSENLGAFLQSNPEYLAGVAGELSGIEGQVKGQLEGLRLKTQKRNSETQLSTELGGIAVKYAAEGTGIDVASASAAPTAFPETDAPIGNADDNPMIGQTVSPSTGLVPNSQAGDQFDGKVIAADDYVGALKTQIDANLESGNFNPQQFAQRNWAGIYDSIVELLNDDQYGEAGAVIDLLKAATKQKIMVGPDGKTNFWDIPIAGANNSSATIQDKIRQAEKIVDDMEAAGKADYLMKELGKLDFRGGSESEADYQKGMAIIREADGLDFDLKVQMMELLGRADAASNRPTAAQQVDMSILRSSPEYRNLTTEQKRLEIIKRGLNGTSTASQVTAELDNLARQNPTSLGLDANVDNARERAFKEGAQQKTLEAVAEAMEKADEAGLNLPGKIFAPNGAGLAERATQVIAAQAWEETRKELDKRLAADPNKEITPDDILDIYKEKIDEATNRTIAEYGQQAGTLGTPTRKTKAYVDLFLGNASANPGQVMKNKVELFSKSFKDEFEKVKGKPLTSKNWKDGWEYLAGRLDQVKDQDGKPVYGPDGVTWLRNAYRKATKSNLEPTDPLKNTGLGFLGFGSDGVSESELERLRGVRDGTRPRKGSEGEKDQASVVDFTGNLLLKIAGTVLPGGGSSASAALLDNPENIQAMAEVWTGRKPLSLKTPPLPQLSATASVEAVPMALSSINHPFALAIGIAEGTRTADGGVTRAYYGHTDPGNGVRNQGNFSAQQGQATPQIADQQWLSKLTRQQMNYQPLLARAGIQQGTQGYNRLMFNILDLTVQAPAAVPDFVAQVPKMMRGGLSVESIAKARADSFYSPRSGRLDAPGFGNNYSRLFSDQRSRAGVWDLRSRL